MCEFDKPDEAFASDLLFRFTAQYFTRLRLEFVYQITISSAHVLSIT